MAISSYFDGSSYRPRLTDVSALDKERNRLHIGWSGVMSEPCPADVEFEALRWLHAHPLDQLQYMGRGKLALPLPDASVVYLDRPGGRRAYTFRIMDPAAAGVPDPRAARGQEMFDAQVAWLSEPDTRYVLSIGGGAYRLFTAVAPLKLFERQLGGDRNRIHEVWGSSGGALLGYAFSQGIDLAAIDRLGYDLYQGKKVELPGLHAASLRKVFKQLALNWAQGRPGSPELGAWVDALAAHPSARRGPDSPPRIPFYAMVSNTRWRHPIAFTQPEYIEPQCKDIFIPCNRRDATAASMAVPFLFRPLRGLAGYEKDLWFDGSIVDENPVMLPFVKWLRDRKARPDTTPKKLRIMLVNLNTRLGESQAVVSLARFSGAGPLIRRMADVCDLLLDSKTSALVRTLAEVEDVSIMTFTLTMGRLSFITRREIPAMIRSGQVLQGWRLERQPKDEALWDLSPPSAA